MEKNSTRHKQEQMQALKKINPIYEGSCISVQQEILEINGHYETRDLVSHPGAVAILAINEKKQILFIKQWRQGAEKILIELPAGRLEKNETPLECAQKELREETGFNAKSFIPFGGIYTTPGFCNEYIHFFLAKDLFFDPLQAEDTDNIDQYLVECEKVPDLVNQGLIIDGKTLAALYLYQTLKGSL